MQNQIEHHIHSKTLIENRYSTKKTKHTNIKIYYRSYTCYYAYLIFSFDDIIIVLKLCSNIIEQHVLFVADNNGSLHPRYSQHCMKQTNVKNM